MSTFRTGLAIAAAALVQAGCASGGYGYSQLDGNRYYHTALDTYPVVVLQVDGKSEVENPVRVLPGRHRVKVQPAGELGRRFDESRTIDLDVQACTRYYLVAVKPNRLAPDFEVKVEHQEPVPGCTPPRS
jgi:hypothetical protein